MNDYKNFLNNYQNINYIIQPEKSNISYKTLMALSLKNISTTYNSHISNDFHSSRNNELRQNMEINNISNQKYDEKVFKTSNNYFIKKDYSKYLNVPQSNDSTICDSKYKFYSNNHFTKEQNLNSNLKGNKLYNQLKINDLINIIQKRKKIIEEKKRIDYLKQINLKQEQEKLMNIISVNDEINNNYTNKNRKCEEGVQTSLNFNNENKSQIKFNPQINNNIQDKNTLENDLVNLGINTEEENIDSNLIFNIEENKDISKQIESNEQYNDSFENKIKENCYNSSSSNENNISNVEEYDINKEYLKNETKSDIQDYINECEKDKNNFKEKINIKLNKSKSVTSMAFNRYENLEIKNSDNFEHIYKLKYSNDNIINKYNNEKFEIINNKIKNIISFKNDINNKKIEKNLNAIKDSYLIKKINENKSFKNYQKIKNLNKTQFISKNENNNINISNKIKKKRNLDNYSYYYKLKDKTKSNNKK